MKKKISITLDADVLNKIEKLCNKEDRTTSNMINMLLKQALGNYTDKLENNSEKA
ncbi:MAG: ribbon-helix-helix protein, CopG family [Defluviitaleaceae bacterium]|nr:ribbon-helix-helix protein, CopG family [Defluviitaleaceae bacterium]